MTVDLRSNGSRSHSYMRRNRGSSNSRDCDRYIVNNKRFAMSDDSEEGGMADQTVATAKNYAEEKSLGGLADRTVATAPTLRCESRRYSKQGSSKSFIRSASERIRKTSFSGSQSSSSNTSPKLSILTTEASIERDIEKSIKDYVTQISQESASTSIEPIAEAYDGDDCDYELEECSAAPTIPTTLQATLSKASLLNYRPKANTNPPVNPHQIKVSFKIDLDNAVDQYRSMTALLGPGQNPPIITCNASTDSKGTVEPVDLAELKKILEHETEEGFHEIYDAIAEELGFDLSNESTESAGGDENAGGSSHRAGGCGSATSPMMSTGDSSNNKTGKRSKASKRDKVEYLVDCYASIAGESTLASTLGGSRYATGAGVGASSDGSMMPPSVVMTTQQDTRVEEKKLTKPKNLNRVEEKKPRPSQPSLASGKSCENPSLSKQLGNKKKKNVAATKSDASAAMNVSKKTPAAADADSIKSRPAVQSIDSSIKTSVVTQDNGDNESVACSLAASALSAATSTNSINSIPLLAKNSSDIEAVSLPANQLADNSTEECIEVIRDDVLGKNKICVSEPVVSSSSDQPTKSGTSSPSLFDKPLQYHLPSSESKSVVTKKTSNKGHRARIGSRNKGVGEEDKEDIGILEADGPMSKSSKQVLDNGAIKEAFKPKLVPTRLKNMSSSCSLPSLRSKTESNRHAGFKSLIRLRSLSRGRSAGLVGQLSPMVENEAEGDLEGNEAVKLMEKIPQQETPPAKILQDGERIRSKKKKSNDVQVATPNLHSRSRGKSKTREDKEVAGKKVQEECIKKGSQEKRRSSSKSISRSSSSKGSSGRGRGEDKRGLHPDGTMASTKDLSAPSKTRSSKCHVRFSESTIRESLQSWDEDSCSTVEPDFFALPEKILSKGANWFNWDTGSKSYETTDDDLSRGDDAAREHIDGKSADKNGWFSPLTKIFDGTDSWDVESFSEIEDERDDVETRTSRRSGKLRKSRHQNASRSKGVRRSKSASKSNSKSAGSRKSTKSSCERDVLPMEDPLSLAL